MVKPKPERQSMSISEAARRYQVSQRTLQGRVRLGEITGHKARGPHGLQWRVEAAAMEAFGYRLPEQRPQPAPDHNDDVEDLRNTIARLKRDVAHYRRQAAEANRQLGAATREIASLRAAAVPGHAAYLRAVPSAGEDEIRAVQSAGAPEDVVICLREADRRYAIEGQRS
jgi:hypothetical protein